MNSIVNSIVNSKTIIEMAKEAEMPYNYRSGEINNLNPLQRFAALVRADEREACANTVDHILKEGGGTYGDAIRAMGNT